MQVESSRLGLQFVVLWALAFSPSIAWAHEFWIEPSKFVAEVGQRVDVALRVGEHFKGEPVARKADRIVKFAALRLDESGEFKEQPITGEESDEPAGHFVPTLPGSYVLVFQSNHAHIELEGDKFEAYLEEKGLDAIRKRRADRNESDKPAREIYSRCAKAKVFVSGEIGKGLTWPGTGLPLEVVLRKFEFEADGKRPMKVEVLFDGRPLDDVQVTAQSRQANKAVQKARTNSEGIVVFQLTDEGPWLIECTYMRPATDRNDADYESFWASLTFEWSPALP